MLRVNSLETSYGSIKVLRGVDVSVQKGELVSIVGANGAGKTTLLKTIIGTLKSQKGSVEFLDKRVERDPPHARVKAGLVLVPEGRAILTRMTVFENLLVGGFCRRDQAAVREQANAVLERFPPLRARKDNPAVVLSGGEQQMLTIARALMANPKLLMIDEPSLGLAPLMVKEVFEIISDLKAQGMTVLLVEQNAMEALRLASRGYVMEQGRIAAHDSAEALLKNLEELEKAYFGIDDMATLKGGDQKD